MNVLASHSNDHAMLSLPGLLAFPKVSLVIPTLNEARNIALVLPRVPDWIHEVLIVDGLSVDGTIAVARSLLPSVRIIEERQKGKGAALRAGFNAATGDIIVMLDADGSMDPNEIILFVAALVSGADFAKGSRFLQGGGTDDMSIIRMFGNWALTQLVRLLFGSGFSDLCYGYNAFWKRNLPLLNFACNGFEIETALNLSALRSGIKVLEIPSYERLRAHGKSNLHPMRDGFRVLATILGEAFRPVSRARSNANAPIIPELAQPELRGVRCES
jgi:glycosyltransferase involved in cell wall biosynthesis